MIQTNEFRKNLKIEYEGSLWVIVDCQFVKPGKGVAFVKTKMKNMLDGRIVQNNFRSGDKVGKPDVMDVKMQVLYSDGSAWHFMNNKTYEQLEVSVEDLGGNALFLQDGLEVSVHGAEAQLWSRIFVLGQRSGLCVTLVAKILSAEETAKDSTSGRA